MICEAMRKLFMNFFFLSEILPIWLNFICLEEKVCYFFIFFH
jgi:hypothetical protein